MNDELSKRVVFLIKELRNSRDVQRNWLEMKNLIESNIEQIVLIFSTRWLISICDTYADYGDDVEKRNAFILSIFVNTIRIADTMRCLFKGEMDPDRIQQLKSEQIQLYDGLMTLHLDRQDTCLNLSKRMIRLLKTTPLFLRIYETLVKRALNSKNLLSDFASLSNMPERVFPLNALEMADNYGVL